MQRTVMWILIIVLGLVAEAILPMWWGLLSQIPIVFLSWWVAYRSGWFIE